MSYRIITVCTGNICRSPMAEVMIGRAADAADLDVYVDSAGTTDWEAGSGMDARAVAALGGHGIQVGDEHRARKFAPADFDEFDLILALDIDHYEQLRGSAKTQEQRDKVAMLRSFDPEVAELGTEAQGIADPWYGDADDFESTWQDIDAAIPGILTMAREHAQDG